MSTYCLKIKKNKFQINLSGKNAKLILKEFEEFALAMQNFDNNIVEYNNQKLVATKIAKNNNTVQPKLQQETITTKQKPKTIAEITNVPTQHKTLPNNFAQLLKAKTQEENHVVEKKTSELKNTYMQMQNLIKEKALKNEVDYILAAAYCLVHYENITHFSEKQIQSKILPFLDKELDHNFILDAIDKDFIRVLPDFTGMSEVIEFELTAYGEEYFVNEL